MLEASLRVVNSAEFSALVSTIADSFQVTPVEAMNAAVVLPTFFAFMIGGLGVLFICAIIDRIGDFLCWLYRLLKVHLQNRRKKGR